jgi:hypothetical protein
MDSAVSKMSAISPAERFSVPRRSLEWREVVVVTRSCSRFQVSGFRFQDPSPGFETQILTLPET